MRKPNRLNLKSNCFAGPEQTRSVGSLDSTIVRAIFEMDKGQVSHGKKQQRVTDTSKLFTIVGMICQRRRRRGSAPWNARKSNEGA